ncbi:hypothetical protein TNCV_2097621 [Trichonephila clavipes]|nr:hypothetical protein TNCV_2097621 [Trichonephila clavipes]
MIYNISFYVRGLLLNESIFTRFLLSFVFTQSGPWRWKRGETIYGSVQIESDHCDKKPKEIAKQDSKGLSPLSQSNLLIESKCGSWSSRYVRLVKGGDYICVGVPGLQEILRRPWWRPHDYSATTGRLTVASSSKSIVSEKLDPFLETTLGWLKMLSSATPKKEQKYEYEAYVKVSTCAIPTNKYCIEFIFPNFQIQIIDLL